MDTDGEIMTLQGTVNKLGLMLFLVFASVFATWLYIDKSNLDTTNIIITALVFVFVAFFIGLIIAFKPTTAGFLSPIYAIFEGFALAVISYLLNQEYPGIALQALLLTILVAVSMLILYKTKIIKPTENFKLVVSSGVSAIFFLYLTSICFTLAGHPLSFMHDNSPLAIGICVVITIFAALSLVLDFDFIEEAVEKKFPKHFEWYGAWSLTVTLIWLYLEILDLLSRLKK